MFYAIFDTKEQRAKVLAQINEAHALDTDCAAWPVTYREFVRW